MGDVDINTLTIEQYLFLTRGNRPGVVIPELRNDVDFEIKSQFLSELRCNLFAGTNDEDTHEHVQRVLEITDLFNIPGVTWDVVMLRVFPITLTGATRKWKNLLPAGCPQHDLNNHQKVQIFYKGLEIPSSKMVDSQGLIPMMPPAQALKSIQIMADYSQNWYNGATTCQETSHNSNDIVAITKRVDRFERDMKKLRESIHAIHVDCKIYKEVHLTKECPLKEDGNVVEHVKYIGFLEETINKFMEESKQKQAAFDK
ncbi:hypothetical protein Tco_0191329 [Tanacetum coccineum]